MTSKTGVISEIMFGDDYRRELQVTRGFTEDGGTSYGDISNDAIVFPGTALTMLLASTDANDTSAGTGCEEVLVKGLNSNWDRVEETVVLNGVTGVNMLSSLIRVNSVEAAVVGSNGGNSGLVRVGSGVVTAGVPAIVYRTIPVIDSSFVNRDMDCFFSVPKSYHAYVLRARVNGSDSGQIQIWAQTDGAPAKLMFSSMFENDMDMKFDHFKVPEKTDVWVLAKCLSSGVTLHAQMEYCLSYSPGQ